MLNWIHPFLFMLIITGRARDNVDPVDYAEGNEIRPNQFTLKSETYMMSEDDKSYVNGLNDVGLDRRVRMRPGWPIFESVQCLSIRLLRQVIHLLIQESKQNILDLPNNTGLRTETSISMRPSAGISLIHARVIYLFENQLTSGDDRMQTTGIDGLGRIESGDCTNIEGEISFDADSTYFTAQYDSAGTIPFKMNMRLKDLRFNLLR